MPVSEWLKQQMFISHSLEAEKSDIKVLTDSVSCKGPLHGLWTLYHHMVDREGAVFSSSFYKGTNLIMTPMNSSKPNSLPKISTIPSHQGSGFSVWI